MKIAHQIKIMIAVLLISTASSFAQTPPKKLVKSFKFGTVGYNLYTQNGKPNKGLNDTTFYLLYRVGNTKILAKELKEVKAKSGNRLAFSTYQLFPKAIIFDIQGYSNTNKKYAQNNKGLLKMEEYGVPVVAEAPSPAPPTVKAPEYDNTARPVAVDISPEYLGGINNARAFIAHNLEYPEEAQDNDVQGTVYVTFVIAKDGSVTNIKIERGLGYGCDEEVIRVIKRMPKWSPAKLKGKNVASQMRMPVSFRLSDE